MSRKQVVALTAVLVTLAALVAVEPSLAAPPPEQPPSGGGGAQAGQKLAELLKGWGTALLFGVAVLVGLPALAKREIGQSVVILVIVLLIGGFAFAEPTIRSLIQEIWTTMEV